MSSILLRKIVRRIARRSNREFRRMRAFYYYLRFRISCLLLSSSKVSARSQSFDVPVWVYGDGSLKIGSVQFGWRLAKKCGNGEIQLQPRTSESIISIGDGTIFANNLQIIAMEKIEIGCNCMIGEQTEIIDSNFHGVPLARRNQGDSPAPVIIEDNVWIGDRCMILKGVTIGRNSVISAMSLVNKSIPPDSLVAGVPAKVICSIKFLNKPVNSSTSVK